LNYRRFGRTGLKVSEIALGCGAQGGIVIDPDDETKRAAVKRALALGINRFDTAAQYGGGRSEEALGWLLKEVDEPPYLSTKIMLGADHAGDFAGAVARSVEGSLLRLKRGSVDLLQLHSHIEGARAPRAVTADDVLRPGGIAEAMERARDGGLCRFIGISALGDRAETAKVIASGRFDSAQVYYNMIDPSAARAMPDAWRGFDSAGIMDACRAQDMAILAVRVFAAGFLATRQRTGRESILTADTDHDTEARMAEGARAALGDAHGTLAETALRFALTGEHVSAAVIGPARIEHIEQACAAADKGPLPDDALARLERFYETGPGAA
jgi:L-galactose dehydrogenase/L-glyceraldehyde 3-phosphate reductase